jgi:GH24 family phage-related lysozyme (muramidase)
MNQARLKRQLEVDEMRSKKIYTDSVGKISGGIGRNLTDRGFSDDEIDLMYANDIKQAESDARALVPGFDHLNDVRQEVVVNLSFNLGYSRLAGFKRFLSALNSSDFDDAAAELQDSKWFGQVKGRGVRLVKAMRTGSWL